METGIQSIALAQSNTDIVARISSIAIWFCFLRFARCMRMTNIIRRFWSFLFGICGSKTGFKLPHSYGLQREKHKRTSTTPGPGRSCARQVLTRDRLWFKPSSPCSSLSFLLSIWLVHSIFPHTRSHHFFL